MWIIIVVSAVLLVILLVLAAAYVCYRCVFTVPKSKSDDVFDMPDTEQYAPYAAEARKMISAACEIAFEPVTVKSYDKLKLFAKYYPAAKDAPWLILFHGYRSHAERDFSGGLKYGIEHGYNVLLVDQRAHGNSEGRCLTFGIKERRDCLSWIDFVIEKAGENAKIVLYGMSMGAATVLMAAELRLPKNVVGIVADCGFSSPYGIIRKVVKEMRYPTAVTTAFIRLGGIIFGGFDLRSASAAKAMESCDVPVLFIHGDGDKFVPHEMSRENYEHCRSQSKQILIVPNAGHGMSYMVDKEKYLATVTAFLEAALK